MIAVKTVVEVAILVISVVVWASSPTNGSVSFLLSLVLAVSLSFRDLC